MYLSKLWENIYLFLIFLNMKVCESLTYDAWELACQFPVFVWIIKYVCPNCKKGFVKIVKSIWFFSFDIPEYEGRCVKAWRRCYAWELACQFPVYLQSDCSIYTSCQPWHYDDDMYIMGRFCVYISDIKAYKVVKMPEDVKSPIHLANKPKPKS